ncbi:MAG: hypothetical protein K6E10_07580 [Eubacterium sp.]|nr:hypothetical protein [Eubacterium sp.]
MKVIIINGSPRTNGITAATLHTLEKELMESGVVVRLPLRLDLIGGIM